MIRVTAAPFLCVTEQAVVAEPWQTVVSGSSVALPHVLPHWDCNSDLSVLRHLLVDARALFEQCGFDSGAKTRAVVAWRSLGTAVRGAGATVDIQPSKRQDLVLGAEIAGNLLASEVQINTQIVLIQPGKKQSPLAARMPGSVLWEDRYSVLLEGSASRFPMEVLDFNAVRWAPYQAGWFLSWNKDDVDVPFLRNVRLYLNSSHPAVVGAVQATSATPEQRLIRSAIYYDVGRQLIRGALQNDDFIENPDAYPEGSTGHSLLRMLRAFFGNDSLSGLRSTMTERPEYFDARLQGSLKLFVND